MAPLIALYLVLLAILFLGSIPKPCHEFITLRFAFWPAAGLSIASSWIEFILGMGLMWVASHVGDEWDENLRLLGILVPLFFILEGALRTSLNHKLPAAVPSLLLWLPYRLWRGTRT